LKRSGFSRSRGFGGGAEEAYRIPAGSARKRWNCRECRANADGVSDVLRAAMVRRVVRNAQQLRLVPSQSSRLRQRSEGEARVRAKSLARTRDPRRQLLPRCDWLLAPKHSTLALAHTANKHSSTSTSSPPAPPRRLNTPASSPPHPQHRPVVRHCQHARDCTYIPPPIRAPETTRVPRVTVSPRRQHC
jgi:hypothetical protein